MSEIPCRDVDVPIGSAGEWVSLYRNLDSNRAPVAPIAIPVRYYHQFAAAQSSPPKETTPTMSFDHYNQQQPNPSSHSPTSPLSRRRISTCILELTSHSDRISTLPLVQRYILANTACQTLLARNLSIEPNIYNWIRPPDGCGKIPEDYDHDGKPAISCDNNCHCSHNELQHFSNIPCPQYTCHDASKAWQNFCSKAAESSEQQDLPTLEIWNHPPSTPPIANINPDTPNDCKQEIVDKLLSDFAKSIKNPPPQPPTKPPQSIHAPTGVAAFNLSLSITPQGQQFLKNILKSIIEGME